MFVLLGFPGLDQGELLQLMEWLDYYNQEIVNLGAAQPCPEFVQVRTALALPGLFGHASTQPRC